MPSPSSDAVSRDADGVRAIIASHLGVQFDDVKFDSTMQSLGANDLDVVEIVMALGDQFGITISDERFTQVVGSEQIMGSQEKVTVQHLIQLATE